MGGPPPHSRRAAADRDAEGEPAPGQGARASLPAHLGVIALAAYDRAVATASPSPTPNPNATKFTLDTTLAGTFNVTSADAAGGNQFAEDVFAAGGVASVFGVNDFVTVTRQPGADWGPIVAAVQAAAATHL
jgi:hypothetical protein